MPTLKWEVRMWTRSMKTTHLGFVMADHHPGAKKLAYERWPQLRPTKAHPFGRAKIDAVDPPPPRRPLSPQDAAASRAFLDAINNTLLQLQSHPREDALQPARPVHRGAQGRCRRIREWHDAQKGTQQ